MDWVVQNDARFYGQEIETWKSTSGEWAYGYGTEISGYLLVETLVTGFDSETAALEAAERYCYECAVEAACDQGHEYDA